MATNTMNGVRGFCYNCFVCDKSIAAECAYYKHINSIDHLKMMVSRNMLHRDHLDFLINFSNFVQSQKSNPTMPVNENERLHTGYYHNGVDGTPPRQFSINTKEQLSGAEISVDAYYPVEQTAVYNQSIPTASTKPSCYEQTRQSRSDVYASSSSSRAQWSGNRSSNQPIISSTSSSFHSNEASRYNDYCAPSQSGFKVESDYENEEDFGD